MVSIIILQYNIMGPPSYMRSVVDRNVVMRRVSVYSQPGDGQLPDTELLLMIWNWVTRHQNHINDICARRCSTFQKLLLRLRNKFLAFFTKLTKRLTWT
jgi:hypothetical protein